VLFVCKGEKMILDPQLGLQLILGLGIINVILVLMVFFSCRCMLGKRFSDMLMKSGIYKKFYSKHCYYWWLLFLGVILHAVLAFIVFINPI